MVASKKEVEETHEHEKGPLEEQPVHEKLLAEDQRQDHRELVETIQGLPARVRDIRCAS